MTTEEKAKAYDEALERARANYKADKEMGFLENCDMLELIFPELRESEDERIREEIKEFILKHADRGDLLAKRKRWIVYLEKQKNAFENGRQLGIMQEQARQELEWEDEKQKEQKPIDNGTREKIINRAKSEKQVVLISESNGKAEIGWDTRSLEDSKNLLEYGLAFINEQLKMQKEQKPISQEDFDTAKYEALWDEQKPDNSDEQDKIAAPYQLGRSDERKEQKERGPLTKEEEYTLHRIIEYLEDETCPSEWISLLYDIYCLPYEKQKEQKPVGWNDTDMDEARNNLISCCRDWERGKTTTLLPIAAVRARYFLEQYIKPPVEWSEEDEEKLYQVIETLLADKEIALREYPLCKSLHEAYDDMITFLKSLRPQKKEDLPKWRRIRIGEKIPCRAYLYKLAYETDNNFLGRCTVDGYLVPNEPVTCGCDTWYLPVDEIKNLPKEDEK